MLILSDPKIPDRTKAILHGGPSPVPFIIEDCHICAAAGCDVIAVPCNTSHYFIEEIQRLSPVPVLNMIELVADELVRTGASKAFIMATEGTIRSGLYTRVLEGHGIVSMSPDEDEIANLMEAIYAIKAGEPVVNLDALVAMIERYRTLGCEKVILGCTELSLLVEDMTAQGIPSELFVNSTDVLIKAILKGFSFVRNPQAMPVVRSLVLPVS